LGLFNQSVQLLWLACDPTLLTGHFYRPPVIAFTHVVGLGFIMSLAAGSCYQLLPVAFENSLFSRTLAKIRRGLRIGYCAQDKLSWKTAGDSAL